MVDRKLLNIRDLFNKTSVLTFQEFNIMDHWKNSENVIMHSILCVKLEPFDEDEDCTQNIDSLQPDSNIHQKMELLQNFKTEIKSDSSDQAMNDLIQEDMLKNDSGDTATKIEEVNIKTEYVGNEASALDDILDSRGIIVDNTIVPNQLSVKNSSTNAGKKNTTTYELNHSCEPQNSDVINVVPTNDAFALNVTSPVNHSRARSDTCSSRVDVHRIHKHSTSEEGGSKQSSSLIAHSLRHASYACDVCNMEFKNSRNMVTHKVIHTNQKPHACDICNKKCSSSSALATHKRIHTGQKPYDCGVCKKKFSRAGNLATHKLIHTGLKPHGCDICEKKFSQAAHLASHKLIHTGQKPHVCDICKMKFSEAGNLARHIRIHTGQKPHVCDICNKQFNQANNLAIHKRIHSSQKPYVCDICKKEFRHSSALTKHKLVHTATSKAPCLTR